MRYLLTYGEYSDFSVFGVVESDEPIDFVEAFRGYLPTRPKISAYDEFDSDFLDYLVNTGIARRCEIEEIWLGPCGQVSEDFRSKLTKELVPRGTEE